MIDLVNNKKRIFNIGVIGLSMLGVFFILFTRGRCLSNLRWQGETAGIFPDLFQSIGAAISDNPYDQHSIYPALSYCFFRVMGVILPGHDSLTWAALSLTRDAVIITGFFYIITLSGIWFIAKMSYPTDNITLFCLKILFYFSTPFIYMFERGNTVILSLLFVMVFLYGYDSPQKNVRLLACVSLGVAANLKLYPAVLGILLASEKRWHECINTLLIGIILFVVPFFAFNFGGIASIIKMIKNISLLSSSGKMVMSAETGVIYDFGYGFKVNSYNMIDALSNYISIDYLDHPLLILLVVNTLCVFSAFFNEEKWKKVTSLLLILIIGTPLSWIYNVVYLFPALLFFMKVTRLKKMDYLYLTCFIFSFIAFPFGTTMRRLGGDNCMTLSTVVCSLSLHSLLLLLSTDSIKTVLKGIKLNGSTRKV